MNDLDLIKKALETVVKRGQTTVQTSIAFLALLNEIMKLDEERRAYDALRDPSS